MKRFTPQEIDEYLDPQAALHSNPVKTRGEAANLARDLFQSYASDPEDSLENVGTVDELAEALFANYTAEKLAGCPCLSCRKRRGEVR